jgi:hypothetical protein
MNKFMRFDATAKNAFDNDEVKYANFEKLLVDAARKQVQEYSAEQANTKIVEKFREALGIDENARTPQVRRAIRANQALVFTIIEETVEEMIRTGWDNNPFFMDYAEIKNRALGDTNDFYVEDDSILSVSKISGNHHNMIRQRLGAGRHFAVTTEWFGLKIYTDFERVLTGAEDWASFILKIADAVNRYIYDAVYAALKGASEKLGANWVKTGALDTANKATLVKLCQDIEMATGSEVVIFGTRSALSALSAMADVNWMPDTVKNEYYQNGGLLGLWEGFRVAEIGQGLKRGAAINSATVDYQVDSNQLYIVPVSSTNKFIKIVNEGDAQISQVSDKDTNRDMSYEYEYMFKMGISVIFNSVFGFWKVA